MSVTVQHIFFWTTFSSKLNSLLCFYAEEKPCHSLLHLILKLYMKISRVLSLKLKKKSI